MPVDLSAPEIRVLGCLLEKQRTTPDAYPLSLNALRLACNQATNRDPVTEYDDAPGGYDEFAPLAGGTKPEWKTPPQIPAELERMMERAQNTMATEVIEIAHDGIQVS